MAAINFLSDNYAATARWMMGPTQLVEIIYEVAFLFLIHLHFNATRVVSDIGDWFDPGYWLGSIH